LSISQQTIQEIKSRIDIVEVIGDFVSLKKAGGNYRALSPFTNEKTPSFYVSPSKEIYKCFSTGKGGDALSFVMEVEGINYIEALKYMANKYGIEVEEEEQTDEQIQAQNERDSLFIVLNFAKDYFAKLLWEHEDGKAIGFSYFKERGFLDATIKQFELGYSIETWDGLLKAAIAKGFKEEILEKAGLIVRKEEKKYDRFRGRVMFPIHNVTGKVIAFGARTLRQDKKQPKYINSPETDIYHKSNILYGIHQARQTIRNEDLCFLVEGYTDVISLHQSGVTNVVASSGTSLTKEQIQLIGRYTKNITVLYDGDSAGIKASFRGIDLILEHDLNVRAVVFPDGEDPDSYSRKLGDSEFEVYLKDNAQDFITFKTNVLTDGGKQVDPVQKVKVIREVVESISLIPDGIKRSVYIKSCSDQLQIEEQILISELNKILIKNQRKDNQRVQHEAVVDQEIQEALVAPQQKEVQHTTFYVERECLRMLINYSNEPYDESLSIGQFIVHETNDLVFEDPELGDLYTKAKAILNEGKVIKPDMFMSPDDNKTSQLVIGMLDVQYFVSEGWYERHKIHTTHESERLPLAAFKTVLRLKRKKLETLLVENDEELKKAQEDKNVPEQDDLLKMRMQLKTMFDQVSSELGIVVSR
jgi:DNA primase